MHIHMHIFDTYTSTYNIHTKGDRKCMLIAFFRRASGALDCVAEPRRLFTLKYTQFLLRRAVIENTSPHVE